MACAACHSSCLSVTLQNHDCNFLSPDAMVFECRIRHSETWSTAKCRRVAFLQSTYSNRAFFGTGYWKCYDRCKISSNDHKNRNNSSYSLMYVIELLTIIKLNYESNTLLCTSRYCPWQEGSQKTRTVGIIMYVTFMHSRAGAVMTLCRARKKTHRYTLMTRWELRDVT